MGKRAPVVECQQADRHALRRCLAPNRRVEVLVWVAAPDAR
jgi:outer membrane protein OmpA-like peptidoglycan-associated protein